MSKGEVIPWEVTKRGLARITEANINRIMRHSEHGMVIISANRSDIKSDNPNCDLTPDYQRHLKATGLPNTAEVKQKWLASRNKAADEALKKDIIASKFAFTPVFGGYHGSDGVEDSFEPSFIVYNHGRGGAIDYGDFDILLKYALEWCKKYKQDSVYVQRPNEAPVYMDCNGNVTSASSTKNTKINRDNEEFYTTTKRDKTNPQRFTADIKFNEMYCHRGAPDYNAHMRRCKLGEVFMND